MSGFERRGATIDKPAKRRSPGWRFGDLGDRFARSFAPTQRGSTERMNRPVTEPVAEERELPWDEVLPRFPIARQGYDCAVVDEHVADLERELTELDQELAELRAYAPARIDTAAEIERIGEQTASILLAAHESAQETASQAQAQADRCIADAASNAVAITTEANRKLSELQDETASLQRERARLLEDVRRVADALSSLAQDEGESISPEPVRADFTKPVTDGSLHPITSDPPEG